MSDLGNRWPFDPRNPSNWRRPLDWDEVLEFFGLGHLEWIFTWKTSAILAWVIVFCLNVQLRDLARTIRQQQWDLQFMAQSLRQVDSRESDLSREKR